MVMIKMCIFGSVIAAKLYDPIQMDVIAAPRLGGVSCCVSRCPPIVRFTGLVPFDSDLALVGGKEVTGTGAIG